MNITITTETTTHSDYHATPSEIAESLDAACTFKSRGRQLSAVELSAPSEHCVSDNYAKIGGLMFAEFCLLRNIGFVDKAIADNYVNGGLHQHVIGNALREHLATLKKKYQDYMQQHSLDVAHD